LETTPAPPPHPQLINSGAAICGDADGRPLDDAIAPMVIRVGGPSLARAVHDKDFSTRNPEIAHESAGTVTAAEPDETAD
jgi:hypothetical protein